jgi:hypothetical protein
VYCAEAAVELLIGHAVWLRSSDFVGEFDLAAVAVG